MTITIGGVYANSPHDCTIPPKTVPECNALTATAGAGVARRGQAPDGDGDGVADGLSIGHISPLSSKSFRIVKEYWAGTPSVAQWRNGEGSLVAGEGRSASVEWTPGASFLRVRKPSVFAVASSLDDKGASLRGRVSGFSRRSRDRLLQLLAKVNRQQIPLFVTLTYPGQFPSDPLRWKRDLDTFGKRFRREFPGGSFIWKLEPQQRGAPHFHLLAWGGLSSLALFYERLRAWLPAVWYAVVASGDERHLRAGTGVQYLKSWNGVIFYACKYMSKAVTVGDDAWGRAGRWWGVVGRDELPLVAVMVAQILYNPACDLMRWLRRFRRLRGRDAASMWAVVSNPDAWIDALERHIRG